MSSTDAYNAPCEVGADVHGREILVLKHLRSTWEISERKAAKEMLDMGIITVQDYNHSIREAHLEAERRAKAAEAKQMDPYKGKNRVIMMEWEKPYMEACVDHMAINSSSVVLEIGFGLGYSATRIQSYRPKRHVIIECNKNVLEHAKEWQQNRTFRGVEIVPLTWQKFLAVVQDRAARILQQKASPSGKDGGDDDKGSGSGIGGIAGSKRKSSEAAAEPPMLAWPYHFTHVFFDDFPLPLEDKEEQAELAAKDSRWPSFIAKCAQAPGLLNDGVGLRVKAVAATSAASVSKQPQLAADGDGDEEEDSPSPQTLFSGYLARRLVPTQTPSPPKEETSTEGIALPMADSSHECRVLSQIPFEADVPDNCPYLPAGKVIMYIPLIRWRKTTMDGGDGESAGAEQTILDVEQNVR